MGTMRKWTAQEKLAIILDGMKDWPIKEICREYGISETQYYRWRDQAIEGMKSGFRDKRREENWSWETERNHLLKLIGEQQLIIDLQKKYQEHIKGGQKTANRPSPGQRRTNIIEYCPKSDVFE